MDILILLLPFNVSKNLLITNKTINIIINSSVNTHPFAHTHIGAISSFYYLYNVSSTGITKFVLPLLQLVVEKSEDISGKNHYRLDAMLLGACTENHDKIANAIIKVREQNLLDIHDKRVRLYYNRCIRLIFKRKYITMIELFYHHFKYHLPKIGQNMFIDLCQGDDENIIKYAFLYMKRTYNDKEIHHMIDIGLPYTCNLKITKILIENGLIYINGFSYMIYEKWENIPDSPIIGYWLNILNMLLVHRQDINHQTGYCDERNLVNVITMIFILHYQ